MTPTYVVEADGKKYSVCFRREPRIIELYPKPSMEVVIEDDPDEDKETIKLVVTRVQEARRKNQKIQVQVPATICWVFDTDQPNPKKAEPLVEAVAFCSPTDDPVGEVGREWAFRRAMQAENENGKVLPKEIRTACWHAWVQDHDPDVKL